MTKSLSFHTQYKKPSTKGIEFTEPSLTQQHYKDECDINSIIEKYGILAVAEKLQKPIFDDNTPDVIDYTDGFDFEANQNKIASIKSKFYELPASVRSNYDHNINAWYKDQITLQINSHNELVDEIENLYKDTPIQEEKSPVVDPTIIA